MKNTHKYKNDQLSDAEQDALFGPLIRSKFEKDQREKWSGKLAEEYGVYRQATPVRQKSRYWLKVVAAVGVAATVLLLIFRPFQSDQRENITAMTDRILYEDIFPNYLQRKDANEAPEIIRSRASEAYSTENYEEAVRYGLQLRAAGKADVWDEFYLSLSYLYAGDYEQALANLESTAQLSQNGNGDFREEIRWFSALAYLKTEQIEKARAYLEQIPPGAWKYPEAQDLLTAMTN